MPQEDSSAASPVRWEADGTPHSRQFDDTYRSYGPTGDQGLAQSRHVFLQGCGLWTDEPAELAWSHRPQWHVLETGFGLGLNFLATWHAWRNDPLRPQRLFFTSIEAWPVSAADIRKSTQPYAELHALGEELAHAWRGMLPGVHRLEFDEGRVQLTLCIGPVERMLREPDVYADSVYLDGFNPEVNPQMWEPATLKAVARLCRTGTRLASWCVKGPVREALTRNGFQVRRKDGLPPKWQRLEATFAPQWTPISRMRTADATTTAQREMLVLGAGLAGAAVANSLARRGWTVTVLDLGSDPGAGASGLPAGIVAPHVSADDGILSRTTRAGVRATLQRAERLLQEGVDWAASGVLEHQVAGKHQLPQDERWPIEGQEWSRKADSAEKQRAGIGEADAALWHSMAGWIRPRQFVAAQLAQTGVTVRWNSKVASIRKEGECWQLLDATGAVLQAAPRLVLAGGYHTLQLLQALAGPATRKHLPLDPLRGQITWGSMGDMPESAKANIPPFPVNGHGSLIANVAMPAEWNGGAPGWVMGSTFEREDTGVDVRSRDHDANWKKLEALLPALSQRMKTNRADQGWAALRCALSDRLPAVGELDPAQWPGLYVSVGMGARGISLAVLCAELLASHLEAEPLPLSQQLASRLAASRFLTKR